MASTATYLSAEEYALLADSGGPTELVRGSIVRMNPPFPRHGQICRAVDRIFGNYIDQHDLGHVLINDTGVITQRDPDTVRGADVSYYSFDSVPKGPLPQEYLSVPPEIVFEVLSAGRSRTKLLAKVAEYLDVGVSAVCVLDDEIMTAQVFRADRPLENLTANEELTFPGIIDGFRVVVHRFFQ
jgi:Uma2 family endonuclease